MLFGPDLTQFVREGNTRGLFEGKAVLSLLTGEPEWLLPLKDEVPEGWTVTGYPWDEITEPKHKAFVDAYRAKYNETPRLGSLLGYMVLYMIRDAIERAGSTETEAIIKALEDAKFDTVRDPSPCGGSTTSPAWARGSASWCSRARPAACPTGNIMDGTPTCRRRPR